MGSYTSSYSGKGSSSSYTPSKPVTKNDTTLEKVIKLLQKVSEASTKVDEAQSKLKEAKDNLRSVQEEATKEISRLDPELVSTISALFAKSGVVSEMIETLNQPESEL